MSRRMVATAVACALLALTSGLSSASDSPVADGPAIGATTATRGTRQQVTPFPDPPVICAPGSYVHSVDTHGAKLVAFTFDDGPGSWETSAIMTEFEKRGGRATFFQIGGMAQVYPDVAKSVVTRGHEVGNHSQSHTHIGSLLAPEVAYANAVLKSITGKEPRVFRSPGLAKSPLVQAELARLGMCNFFGSVLPGDTNLPALNAQQLCTKVRQGLHPGAIVLMHDFHHAATVAAVPCMLDYAISQGYQLVTVSYLLSQGFGTR